MQMMKYAAAGVGALALGTLLYFVWREDDVDEKVFTEGKLRELMIDIDLEVSCIYARHYSNMVQMKNTGDWERAMMEDIKSMIQIEVEQRTSEVLSKYCVRIHPNIQPDDQDEDEVGISESQFQAWVERHIDADFI